MSRFLAYFGLGLMCFWAGETAQGRGFGGFRGGGFGGGFRGGGFEGGGFRGGAFHGGGFGEGFRAGGFQAGGVEGRGFRGGGVEGGGFRSGEFGGTGFGGRSFSGSRSVNAYSGWRGGYGATRSYDRSYSGARGGSISAEGTRGFAEGPRGGFAAGGTRDVTTTGPRGRTYSGSRQGGVAVGPYGRVVGGASGSRTATGYRGTATGSWHSAFAGHSTDLGLSHYSAFHAGGVAAHSTSYWSAGHISAHATSVRAGFGYYNAFRPAWYGAHPGCWRPVGWTAAAAWAPATWTAVAGYCGISAAPVDYDYGNSVVYQYNNVYVNGQDVGTAQQYATQATDLAAQGQAATGPPQQDKWMALGVFALAQGNQTTSNNIFQLAVNQNGVIRGNYYNGVMDTTTQVYGAVNKKTQRAAWTIGKKKDRVFEAGIDNLTQNETPVLVHFGADKTEQWLLVRVQQPQSSD